LSKKLSEVNIS